MATAEVLSIQGMTKSLKSAGAEFVLEVPRFKLSRGRFYGLVGRSGSGKSTMLDLLAMVARPTSVERYEIDMAGETIDLSRILQANNDEEVSRVRLRCFGYILQSGGLFSFLTVNENLRLPFLLAGIPVAEKTLNRLIELYDLGKQLDKKPSGLSGGQRQRVSILRALALSPSIVLADEPTASVDENMARRIVGEFKELAASTGVTVIMVSHDLDLVEEFADEMVTLKPEVISESVTRTVVDMGA